MLPYSCDIKFTCKKVELVLQVNESTMKIRLERSIDLLRSILPVNRECYLNSRQIIRGIILTGEFSQVRVVSFYSFLALWFPQIPFQTFSATNHNVKTSGNDNKFWQAYLPPSDHECSDRNYPKWYWHNMKFVRQLNDDNARKYYGSPPVEVETALEAWEVETRNVHTTLKKFDEDVWREMPEAEKRRRTIMKLDEIVKDLKPPHLVESITIFPGIDGMVLNQNNINWRYLPYVTLIYVELDSEEMGQLINLLIEKGTTYPRVKTIYLRPEIFSVPEEELAKLLVIFPRVICVETNLYEEEEDDSESEDESEEEDDSEEEIEIIQQEEETDEELREQEEEERRELEEGTRILKEDSDRRNAIGLRVFGRLWHVW